MTLSGTITKAFIQILLLITLTCVFWLYYLITKDQTILFPMTVIGFIGAISFAVLTVMMKRYSHFFVPAYTCCEGIFMGGFITLMQINYPGSFSHAIVTTLLLVGVVLALFLSNVIYNLKLFKEIVALTTSGVVFLYLSAMLLSFIGINVPVVNDMEWKGIIFSLFVVTVASLNLIIDFDLIDKAMHEDAPSYVEWYGAFTVMVTLFWLFMEVMRLYSKLLS